MTQQPKIPLCKLFLKTLTPNHMPIPTGLVGYLEYPEEYPKSHNEPYTVYNLNQVTQSLLYNLCPNQFEIHHNHPPTPKTDLAPNVHNVFSLTTNYLSNDKKDNSTVFSIEQQQFLNKFNFSKSHLYHQDLHRLMTLLCEFQDVYSQHRYDFGLIDIPFHITLKPDAELKKQRITKIPIHYKEKLKKY